MASDEFLDDLLSGTDASASLDASDMGGGGLNNGDGGANNKNGENNNSMDDDDDAISMAAGAEAVRTFFMHYNKLSRMLKDSALPSAQVLTLFIADFTVQAFYKCINGISGGTTVN